MEIIEFTLFDLKLQEPMALVTNWMLAFFSFYAYFSLKVTVSDFGKYWKYFYLMFGWSTFFGGLGHLFFQYTGMYGKFPCWILGTIAGIYASFAMISTWPKKEIQVKLRLAVVVKAALLLSIAMWTKKFVFIAIDTSFTYIIFCGFYAYRMFKKDFTGMNYFYWGVCILLPSAFIFGLKINLHRFLNKDDLSHLFMLGCIILFYKGVQKSKVSGLQITDK